VLAANLCGRLLDSYLELYPGAREAGQEELLIDQQLSGMPDIKFSQTRVLIVGQQQLPQQLLSGQMQQLQYLGRSARWTNFQMSWESLKHCEV
jgi:hypothetical protein